MTTITLSKTDLDAIETAAFADRQCIFDCFREITFTIDDDDGTIVDCTGKVPRSLRTKDIPYGPNLARAADIALARYDAAHRKTPCTVIPFQRRAVS